jgi:CIC family chloride channel protein
MPLSQLSLVLNESHHHGLPVLNDAGQLWGIVTVSDLEQALDEGRPSDTLVAEIGTSWPHLKVTFLDESIGEALARMGTRGLGRMPVVSRENPYDLVGMIRRQDIIRAYDMALTRRDETKDRTARIQQLQQEDGTEFVEVFLQAGDPVVGKRLQEVAPDLPLDCVLISVERDGRVIIPHGSTIFQAGDHITAYTRQEDAAKLFGELHNS